MKKIYTLFLLIFVLPALAQDRHCGTDVAMKKIYDNDPGLAAKKRASDEAQRSRAHRASAAVTSYTIPVVFHIMHQGGPENISDAQVKDGMRILNRDFAKRNPDTTEIIQAFKNIADSTSIHFVLATKDPSGNCTNGIIHHFDTDADWNNTSPTIYSHGWDATQYMNVYIVRTITLNSGFNASGYTYLPGTWSPGDRKDAIVVLNNYFGTIGTGQNFLSRVLTHEVGHWLNLHHVFGNSNNAGAGCSGDDFVNDTPQTPGYLVCPDPNDYYSYQQCNPGVDENFQNYMDYSYCCRMFTHDQAGRMQDALQDPSTGRDNLWSTANLIATGVINPTGPCMPIADFKYNRSKTCAGTPVTFTDATWNGEPTAYTWSFPGGTPATSTASAPVVIYTMPGIYSVIHSSSNSAGTSAPVTKSSIITVTDLTAPYATGWFEGFESITRYNNDWIFTNSSGASKWERSSDASRSGIFSAKIPYASNARRTVTAMQGPAVSLAGINSPVLSFDLAAAEFNSDHVNTLRVYASTDCGTSWHLIYGKSGAVLITTNNNLNDFVPSVADEWRHEIIGLSSMAAETFVSFKFEYTRDTIAGANNIYIDNINISGGVGFAGAIMDKVQNLSVFPVPSNGSIHVSFELPANQELSFVLSDIAGCKLESYEDMAFSAGQHVQTMNVESRLSKGVYFLSIKAGGTQQTHKIIIGE